MHSKSISIALALLALTIFGCSNEPSSTSSTKAKTQSTVEINQPAPSENQPIDQTNEYTADVTQDICGTTLNQHCVACHHSTRFCQKLGKKNEKGWQRTIKNMVRHGLLLTANETDTLVQCLYQKEQEMKDYCQ